MTHPTIPPQNPWRNGFIYRGLTFILALLAIFNPLEWSKRLTHSCVRKKGEALRKMYVANAVDAYTVIKWVFLFVLWKAGANGLVWAIIVWWLLLANLHTFLYYFLFKPELNIDFDRSRKRFIKLGIAFLFSDLCFAWLMSHYYFSAFSWPVDPRHGIQAIWYSISNSVAGDFPEVKPRTAIGHQLATIQHVITFLFVGVLVTKAIPASPAQA